jgi:HSP20 family protein
MARDTGTRKRGEDRDSTAVTRRSWRSPAMGVGASPFGLLRRLTEDMDRLDRQLWSGGRDLEQVWAPQIETFRRGDQLVIRADLPGMKKEDVNVEIDNDVLTISGERREEHEEERDDYYRSERSYGRFYRALALPAGVGEEQCEASFRDGVLEITMPAPTEGQSRGRRIDIR